MTAPEPTTATTNTQPPHLAFAPPETTPTRAGIILFHGGGLTKGTPEDLAPHARHLAAHGIFTVSAGYRLLGQGATSIDDCLADVRSAIEHFGNTAAEHGLEPTKLAIGGSSAGAHLALLAAMTDDPDSLTQSPAAIVALNPAGLDLAAFEPELRRSLEDRVGIGPGRLVDYSVIEHIRRESPRTLIQHGTEDEIEPIAGVRRYRDAMERAGNECTLVEYGGARHAFHYPGGGHFDEVMDATIRFLLERG